MITISKECGKYFVYQLVKICLDQNVQTNKFIVLTELR